MDSTLRAICAVASAIAAAAVALLPAGADAAGGLRYVASAPKASFPQSDTSAVVLCPDGWNAIGGGVHAGGGFERHELTHTGPAGKGGDPDQIPDGWAGGARDLRPLGSKPLVLRSWAVCTRKYVRLIAAGTGDVDPGEVRTSSIGSCASQPGFGLAAGGVHASGGQYGGFARVSEIHPAAGGAFATATMHNLGSFPTSMHISALCAKGSFTYVAMEKTVGPQEQARLEPRCPQGTHVTGGGSKVSGDEATLHLAASFPRDLSDRDKAPDDAWRVHANNLGQSSRTLTAYAICRG